VELTIVLAVLSILGAIAVTTTAGAIRSANVEATAQGVEQLGQWRSQVAAANRQGTINCWNAVDLSTACNGGIAGDPSIPGLINENKPLFWPRVKAKWAYVCDQAQYPDHYRRVSVIVGACDPNWDGSIPLNSEMNALVSQTTMQLQ
jgi:type II secretory pathway pseudopilin PulG